MTQVQQQFEKRPGEGYFFHVRTQEDVRGKAEEKAVAKGKATAHRVSLWEGHLTFEDGHSVRLEGMISTRDRVYQIRVKEFPKSEGDPRGWERTAEFTIPALGESSYQDAALVYRNRRYVVRLFKSGKGYLCLRLPQVKRASALESAVC